LSLSAKGLTTGEIAAHFGEVFGARVSRDTISRITEKVIAVMTLFLLDWLQGPGLRRKVTAGLNKGEARNTLARAVFFNRLGEIRDRSFEQQRYRVSGLNLLTAAIVLWNTAYLDRTDATLTSNGGDIDPDLLRFLSPLGWEHINLTGDYTWPRANHIKPGKYRPLRRPANP
jgi:hypothetical protein